MILPQAVMEPPRPQPERPEAPVTTVDPGCWKGCGRVAIHTCIVPWCNGSLCDECSMEATLGRYCKDKVHQEAT